MQEKEMAQDTTRTPDPLTRAVIGSAIEVHRTLGPGLLESTHQKCLAFELSHQSILFQEQAAIPVIYKGVTLECGYRADFLIEDHLVVELKVCQALSAVDQAQILTYMKLAEAPVGLLINFNVVRLKEGIRRFSL